MQSGGGVQVNEFLFVVVKRYGFREEGQSKLAYNKFQKNWLKVIYFYSFLFKKVGQMERHRQTDRQTDRQI